MTGFRKKGEPPPPGRNVYRPARPCRMGGKRSHWPRRDSNPHGGYPPGDFRTTIAFATRGLRFVVWTMPSPCVAATFRREPSRLYTLPAGGAGLSSALPSARLEGSADF